MEQEPRPLPIGTVVADRFEIEELLGRGGFACAYLVLDRLRGDLGVMKELAPAGVHRNQDGLIVLDQASGQHLRQRFLEEARLLSRLHLSGIPQLRATVTDLGTAYYVTDYVAGGRTVEDILDKQGPTTVTFALDVIHPILDTLEGLHSKGYLHRDLKPSNILVSPDGTVYLLDFGSAREWQADAGKQHTVLFTPGYAPMEQLSERARRGPATDIYALCATAYHMLTGRRPPAPPDRASGTSLIPIRSLRPEVPIEVASTIEAGLSMSYVERPQSIAQFRDQLEVAESNPSGLSLTELDRKLVDLHHLSYGRRECPACGGVLDEPRPLKRGVCPVCHEGLVKPRHIDDRLCPVCRVSPLRLRSNQDPLLICPICSIGQLHRHRKGLIGGATVFHCIECEARFEGSSGGMTVTDPGTGKTDVMIGTEASFEEWRRHSGRGTELILCDGCGAQFDQMLDGRRRQIVPKPNSGLEALYPDEWARVAAGLEPGSGNAECISCEADYFVEGETLTLLGRHHDPNGFGQDNIGRLLTFEEVRWMGVGKESPAPGYVCGKCRTEFDREGDYLRLIQTKNRALMRYAGSVHVVEDWHRLARGLPRIEDEEPFRNRLDDALRKAYRIGELSFDNDGNLAWVGPAEREGDDLAGTLEARGGEISFGGRIGRWRVPIDACSVLSATENEMTLRVSGEPGPSSFLIEPQTIEVELQSGRASVELTAEDLAARLGLSQT